MNSKQKQIFRTLQVLLWLWFGMISSFVSANVVNISKLETQVENINQKILNLEQRHLMLKYYIRSK
jgi:hypothetical protein